MNRIAIALAAMLLTGCAATVDTVSATPPRIEQVRDRSYELGVAKTVVVGEPLVKVREYDVSTTDGAAFEVLDAASGRAGMGTFNLSQGQRLPIIAARSIEGRRYLIGMTPEGMGIQVAEDDGSIFNKVINQNPMDGSLIPVLPALNFTPSAPRLRRVTDTSRNSRGNDVNFEIVFTGTDATSLRFQYREYTADNLARPAFSQDLTYPRSADRIRFRQISIKVLRVGVDDIEYIVEAD